MATLGSKTISRSSSLILTINNIMGPAMVAMPLLVAQAGWLPCSVGMIVISSAAALSATMLCDALQRIPGNHNFDALDPHTNQRYEFCGCIRHYMGHIRGSYEMGQVIFNMSLQASNIAAMVASAQTLDDFLVRMCGYSAGYDYWNNHLLSANSSSSDLDGLWGGSSTVLTLGLLLTMVICIPFGLKNLEENISFQWLSFFCLVAFSVEFCVQFMFFTPDAHGHVSGSPHFSNSPVIGGDLHSLFGVIAFSFAFVVTMPSWVNEKQAHVGVNWVVWTGCIVSGAMLLALGLTGCWAYTLVGPNTTSRDSKDSQNILLILNHRDQPVLGQWASYLFAITTLIPGIPVLMVVIRYNLMTSGVCSYKWAVFWGAIAPWIATGLMYQTDWFTNILNWAAVVCQGFVNFVVPPVLYYFAVHAAKAEKEFGDPLLIEDGGGEGGGDHHHRPTSTLSSAGYGSIAGDSSACSTVEPGVEGGARPTEKKEGEECGGSQQYTALGGSHTTAAADPDKPISVVLPACCELGLAAARGPSVNAVPRWVLRLVKPCCLGSFDEASTAVTVGVAMTLCVFIAIAGNVADAVNHTN